MLAHNYIFLLGLSYLWHKAGNMEHLVRFKLTINGLQA